MDISDIKSGQKTQILDKKTFSGLDDLNDKLFSQSCENLYQTVSIFSLSCNVFISPFFLEF